MLNQWLLEKKFEKKKKRKEEPENVSEKKNGKKENEERYKHFFVFTDFLGFGTVAYIVLLKLFYCYSVNQFDMRKSSILV